MERFINLKTLQEVRVVDKTYNYSYNYKPFKKGWFWDRKEGFYCGYTGELEMSIERAKKQKEYLFLNNNLYYKPYVQLRFLGETRTTKEFETYEEALRWGRDFAEENMVDIYHE